MSYKNMPGFVGTAALSLAMAGVPVRAEAQDSPRASGWRIAPSVGVLIDDYDAGDDGSRAGAAFGVNASRHVSGPFGVSVSLGYARVNDIAHHTAAPSRLVYRNEWIFASAGPALEVAVQRATVGFALEVGAAWRRTPESGRVGNPEPDAWRGGNDFSVREAMLPSVTVLYPMTDRISLKATGGAYVTGFMESAFTSPIFGIGVSVAQW